MRRRVLAMAAIGAVGLALMTVTLAGPSRAKSSIPERIAKGTLRPAYIRVDGGLKRMPFLSPSHIETVLSGREHRFAVAAPNSPGISLQSLGCAERNQGRNIRVNQDCTYRRQ